MVYYHMDKNNKIKSAKKIGRPSSYTELKADKLCSLISEGNSLVKAAKILQIEKAAIYRWIASNADFRYNYEKAIKDRADFLFEELDELENKMLNNEISVGVFRAVLDSRKWRVSRMNPKKYNDNQTVDLNLGGQQGNPIDVRIHIVPAVGDPDGK